MFVFSVRGGDVNIQGNVQMARSTPERWWMESPVEQSVSTVVGGEIDMLCEVEAVKHF